MRVKWLLLFLRCYWFDIQEHPFFFSFRPPDSKPMRPVRKRPAPEDFLGKGSNKKILMGKYVGFFFLCRVSGFGLVGLGGFVFGVFFHSLIFLYSNFQTSLVWNCQERTAKGCIILLKLAVGFLSL